MWNRYRGAAAAAFSIALLAACDTGTTDPPLATATLSELAAPPISLEWQQKAYGLATQANMNPLAAARLFAATGVAAMRAVESVDATTAATTSSNDNGYGVGGRSRYEARRGAVAGASARVLGFLFPAAAADLEAMVAAQGAAGPGNVHPDFARGVELGRAAGDAAVAHLMGDGFTAPFNRTFPVGPEYWTTTVMPPGGGMVGFVKPWFMTSGSQFRPPPPPTYLSPAFNADLAGVLATAVARTPQQTANAMFWNSGGGSHMPTGYWQTLARTYVADAGMDEAEAAHVFGVLGAAMFDALIAAFEAKYHYWLLRPHQADPTLTTVFNVPNYPAYPSGHGSVSGAAGRVLTHFFPQRASEVNALVNEAALSRVIAGIHYTFDMTAARTMAETIADYVIQGAGY